MKAFLFTVALLFAFSASGEAQFLNRFQWKSRLVILFTPSPSDPLFERQVGLLRSQTDAFEERNVVFMFVTPDGDHENTTIFLDQTAARQLYDHFNPYAYQFEMVLVGLDGNEKFRSANRVTAPSVLLEMIDAMPMRRREILRGYGNKSQIKHTSANRTDGGRPTNTRRGY